MSLLMEALKKAEEAKRRASEANPEKAATPELSLEPLPATSAPTPTGSPLPDLALHLASVDADLAAVPTEAPPKRRTTHAATPASTSPQATHSPPPDSEESARASVRNAFSAKQNPTSESRKILWLALALGGLAATGIGAYFWWQLQGLGSSALTAPPTRAPSGPTAMPVPAPSTTTAITAPPPRPIPETQAAALGSPLPLAQMSEAPAPRVPEPTPATNEAKITPTLAPPPAPAARPAPRRDTPPSGGLHLARGNASPTIEQAYSALQAGRLDEAQRSYEIVLRNDRKNTDALLGLATIAAQQGHQERAQAFYQQALESDPNDPTAQAGILSTRGQADPNLSESRLKTALATQPDAPALLFALGNLYARQQRWSEAQQAYFRAYSTDPENADFIFNLAVSLDQLRQPRLAAQYYRMALQVSEQPGARPVAFDRNVVRQRLGELMPAQS